VTGRGEPGPGGGFPMENSLRSHDKSGICTDYVQNMYRICTEYVQIMYRICTEYVQNMYRICTEYVQNMYIREAQNHFWDRLKKGH
jgi:hypothetical protein